MPHSFMGSRPSFSDTSLPDGGVLRRRALTLIALAALGACMPALAHDFKAGAVRIEHPYAPPSLAGQANAAVYLRGLVNEGQQPDEALLGAESPAAASVSLHQMRLDNGVMRMRAVEAIALPPGTPVAMRQGSADGYHLMLEGLKAPLREGDRIPVRLRFRHGGVHEVVVWVQAPRGDDRGGNAHRHHGH